MTKRRLDDCGFANVLKQKVKEDPIIKQKNAQNTFALLMRAQRVAPKTVQSTEPSYEYFNMNRQQQNPATPLPTPSCYRCTNSTVYDKCTFCENIMCHNCLATCSSCQYFYCSACSILDYSLSSDQVFCLSCKQS